MRSSIARRHGLNHRDHDTRVFLRSLNAELHRTPPSPPHVALLPRLTGFRTEGHWKRTMTNMCGRDAAAGHPIFDRDAAPAKIPQEP
jgi:hypothetical protein